MEIILLSASTELGSLLQVAGIFASVLITTGLVYHAFRQEPELSFTGFLVEPFDDDGKTVAEKGYLEEVISENRTEEQVCHKYDRTFPTWVKMVKCTKKTLSPPNC